MKEKIKNKLNIAIINGKYVADFEQSTETLTTQGWIKWGSDNTFPNYLLDLYKECAIHQSIVDMISQYTFGSESKSNNGDDIINSDDETLSDVINQVITDFIIFGGCMCLKSQTRGGGIDIKWLDMSKCRISEDSKKVYYNNNGWVGYNKQKNIQVFDIVKNGDGVYYYKSPKSRGIYPTPNYIGAIKCLEVERNIDIFHLSSIKNNFVANMAITFVDENYLSISDDDKDVV